jgi:hypothetical protein
MLKTHEWLDRVRTLAATLVETARKRLDDHAERDRGGWAARMEYRRRYTNPDEAKRARTRPPGSEKS